MVSTTTHNETVTVVFYNAGPDGFPGGYLDGPLSVEVSGTFANGTTFDLQASARSQAVISESSRGIKADWEGAGAKFRGSSLLRHDVAFEIEIESPEIGVFGKINMKSVSQD